MTGVMIPSTMQRRRALRPRPLCSALAVAIALGISAPGGSSAAPQHAAMRVEPRQLPEHQSEWLSVLQSVPQIVDAMTTGGSHVQVTNCNDSGPGSLREAVDDAAEDGTVELDDLPCSTITLTTGAIFILKDDLTLQGPDTGQVRVVAQRDGGDPDDYERVFLHQGQGTLTISYLTVADGIYLADARGGCVFSEGSVFLYHSVLTDCHAFSRNSSARGGAVYTTGDLTMKYSTIQDSKASSYYSDVDLYLVRGGGAYVKGNLLSKYSSISGNSAESGRAGGIVVYGNATIKGTTITGNTATHVAGVLMPGGLQSDPPTMSVINSTISGNVAQGVVGGIYCARSLDIRNSTIANNRALEKVLPQQSRLLLPTYSASGVMFTDNPVTMNSTIISGNRSGGEAADIAGFGSINGAANLVGAAVGNTILPADTMIGIDPELLPLADRGGNHLLVHLPRIGSPVLDAGNNIGANPLNRDQRELVREVGAGPDIGAVERQGPLDGDLIFADGFELPFALPAGSP